MPRRTWTMPKKVQSKNMAGRLNLSIMMQMISPPNIEAVPGM
ncbi:hypothetical protein X971_5141 (plasmid) [Agrobacterium tumefaciens LBA4213 (Ach5)]|nr:hypothetical protein X971_5141 [Agrobacterium tumefaciens LBA4213 (Ach5)]